MSARVAVDVLSVMSRDAELALNWNGRAKEGSWNSFRETQEARAAVAELIERGEKLHRLTNGVIGAYRSGHRPSAEAMQRFSMARGQFAAALARVGGAK